MDNSVGDIYIKEMVEKAVEYFGIKKSVEKREVCPEGLMDEGSIKCCIKNIARKLGLDINVKLLYVEDSYFSSKSLV